jgi:hypothetical protein
MSAFHGSLKGQDFKVNRYDMHQIDGPFSRYIFGRLTERNYWKIDRTHEISQAFIGQARELGREWQDSLLDTVVNDELMDPKTRQPLKITRGRMLRMATHVGNESNFRKMVQGWGWDEAAVWGLLRRNMTAQDWSAAQFIWDQFEPLWQESEAMTRRLGAWCQNASSLVRLRSRQRMGRRSACGAATLLSITIPCAQSWPTGAARWRSTDARPSTRRTEPTAPRPPATAR